MDQFLWVECLDQLKANPPLQVRLLYETILNIMSTFVPNKTISIKPSEPEWIHRDIKNMLRKQNQRYKNLKIMGLRKWAEYHLIYIEKNAMRRLKSPKTITC